MLWCHLLERPTPTAERSRNVAAAGRWCSPIHERRDQFHTLRLGENLDLLNPAVNSFLEQAQSYFLQFTGDPAAAPQMALQLLDNLRQQQASAFAYFDTFLVFAALSVPLVALVFMMKRSVAQKGAHIAAE
jgi:MFS transporter, DHA2 family, multidrug resistance protein